MIMVALAAAAAAAVDLFARPEREAPIESCNGSELGYCFSGISWPSASFRSFCRLNLASPLKPANFFSLSL